MKHSTIIGGRQTYGRRRLDYFGWVTVLAAFGVWSAALFQFYFRDYKPEGLFNSDYLTFAAIYRDRFIDGYPWSGWVPPPAPEYFPSMLTYFAVRALSPNLFVAELAFLILKQTALIAAILALARVVLRRLNASTIALTFVCATVPLLLVGKTSNNKFQLVPLLTSPQGHYSTTLCSIILLALLLHWLRRPGWTQLVGLFILAALTAGSDVLIGPFFIGPAVSICLMLYVAHSLTLWRTATLIAVLLAAAVIGRLVGRAIDPSEIIQVYTTTGPDKIAEAVRVFISDHVKFIEGGNVPTYLLVFCGVACCAWLTAVAWRHFRGLNHISAGTSLAVYRSITNLTMFWLLTTFSSVGTILCFGIYVEPRATRYLFLSVVLSLFGWVIAIAYAFQGRSSWSHGVSAACVAAACGVLGVTWNAQTREQTLLNFYPAKVRCLDALAAKYSLQFGLSGYWEAKYYTMLSRANLRIYQLTPHGEIMHWDSNIDWYSGRKGLLYDEPRYTFLVQDPNKEYDIQLDLAYVGDRYGPPTKIEKCDDVDVWIYTGDNQRSLRWLVQDGLASIGEGHSPLDKRGGRVVVPASALFSQTGKRDGTSRVADPTEASGYLIFGPYYSVHTGRYLFELSYHLDASPQVPRSEWDVYIQGPGPLAEGTLDPNEQTLRATVDVPGNLDGMKVEMRVYYPGGGRLVIHNVAIERLN
jgi:hypothetical protein